MANEVGAGIIRYLAYYHKDAVRELKITGTYSAGRGSNKFTALDPAIGQLKNLKFLAVDYNQLLRTFHDANRRMAMEATRGEYRVKLEVEDEVKVKLEKRPSPILIYSMLSPHLLDGELYCERDVKNILQDLEGKQLYAR